MAGVAQAAHYSIGAHDPLDTMIQDMGALESQAALVGKRNPNLAGKLMKDFQVMQQLYQHLLEGRFYFMTLPFLGINLLKQAFQKVQR